VCGSLLMSCQDCVTTVLVTVTVDVGGFNRCFSIRKLGLIGVLV
jgi:hypothetical protein